MQKDTQNIKPDDNKFRNAFLVLLAPLHLAFFYTAYKFPEVFVSIYKFEILFIFWLGVITAKNFKIRPALFFSCALILIFFATITDFVLKDRPTNFLADFSLVFFILGAVAMLGNLFTDKSPKPGKKVLFVANAIVGAEPGVSGGESRFIEIGREWEKEGFDIHLLGGLTSQKLCANMGLDTTIHSVTKSTNDSRLEFFTRTIKLVFYLPILAADFDSGIVYATSEQIYDVLPGAFLKLLYGDRIAFASAVHWLPPLRFWQRKSSKWYNSLLFMISERSGLILGVLSANALLPVSKATYEDMKQTGLITNNTFVVECGVNLGEIRNIADKYSDKKYDGIFMKRIQSVKGIFDLIEIWQKVVHTKPGAKLVIIGSGIDEDKAKEIVKNQKLEKNIEFTGVIYDVEKKYSLISMSKTFILPSYEENWAIVIGEAMATGVPVLCYDLKELKEVWQDSVEFIPLGDKDLFAKRVINLLDDQIYYNKRVDKGLKYVERYSWKKIATDELAIIYKSIS